MLHIFAFILLKYVKYESEVNIKYCCAILRRRTHGRSPKRLSDTIPQDTKIDEIVVVAYGSQKRETMVGSNTEIKAKQFADRPITSIGQALDGASAGVKVSTGTGQPGSSPSIQIRGIGSYGITTAPLYVVDGTVYTGSLCGN